MMIRWVGVPRQREARLYSLSLIITIWFLTKRAIPNHPVKHIAIIIVLKLGLIMYANSISRMVFGILLITLYTSVTVSYTHLP